MIRQRRSLSALAASAGVALVLLTAGGAAQAHGANWSVGIGIGLPGVVLGGGPTYYSPPPPAYYVPAPRPVYYDPPPPVVYGPPPPPVYYRPPRPVYYAPAPVVVGPPSYGGYYYRENYRRGHHGPHGRDWR